MTKTPTDGMQGEGNYAAARRFREAEEAFVKDGPVEEKAREAADALEGPEADALEAARRSTAAGEVHPANPEAHPVGHANHEETLDDRLKETFPASDPPSASPGSD